jgi:hypothetical protein
LHHAKTGDARLEFAEVPAKTSISYAPSAHAQWTNDMRVFASNLLPEAIRRRSRGGLESDPRGIMRALAGPLAQSVRAGDS